MGHHDLFNTFGSFFVCVVDNNLPLFVLAKQIPQNRLFGLLTQEPSEIRRVNLTSTSFQMVKLPTHVVNTY